MFHALQIPITLQDWWVLNPVIGAVLWTFQTIEIILPYLFLVPLIIIFLFFNRKRVYC